MNRLAIVTGANGQDGSYLCELLLEKGYRVFACIRRSSQDTLGLLRPILSRLDIRYIDMNDAISLSNVIREVDTLLPAYDRCELYNLAAQSHVHVSFFVPDYTSECDALGLLRILECVRQSTHKDKMRVYQASTSELYGDTTGYAMQSETTPFRPRSPYATAKLYAYWISRNYRESYGMFICNGILFNHESPRRGVEFVTRKITRGMTELSLGVRSSPILIGNLDAKRDWGSAQDYVRAMWMMLQHERPDDWVVATGEVHSVREIVDRVSLRLGVALTWTGEGVEQAVDETGRVWVCQSSEYMRPNDVTYLCGDASKIRKELGWSTSVTFEALIDGMVDADLESLQKLGYIKHGSA
jgi:GDPmannose 4,6-dehydratase